MGALPSQQPPDWWKTRSPCLARSRAMRSRAAAVARTRSSPLRPDRSEGMFPDLEEPELLRRVVHEEVLRLLVVIEHHAVRLAPDSGSFVAAERRVRGIEVIAVRPDPAGANAAAHAVGGVHVPGPHAGAEPVQGVVGDGERVRLVLEGRHRHHRPEDLLLEDPHAVVALEDGRLDVVAALDLSVEPGAVAAREQLRALLLADVDVGEDLLELLLGRLRADHRLGVERAPLPDALHPLERAFDEARS